MILSSEVIEFITENNISAKVRTCNGFRVLKSKDIEFYQENGIITLVIVQDKVAWNILKNREDFELEMLDENHVVVETFDKETVSEVRIK